MKNWLTAHYSFTCLMFSGILQIIMNTEKFLLGIIAISTMAIAARLWTQPVMPSNAVFMELAEREKQGENVGKKREEIGNRMPWVNVRRMP